MLANCLRCEKAFRDDAGRGVCPACRGQIAFAKRQSAPSVAPARTSVRATPLVHSIEHVLRCEVYAQLGRAHEPSIQIGNNLYM